MEEFGMGAQAGFRPDRGTIDGILTTLDRLHKRKGHGFETWALFIELVKAFDALPRESLPKKGTFRFAKIGVVFVFLTYVRSCCRLYLCVGCK